MKPVVTLLLTALVSFVLCLYLDWWAIALAAFLVALVIPQKPWVSFLTGFMALALLWGIMAIWIDTNNGHILSHKMAALLPFGGSVFLLILSTALTGGLVAGFAALAASYLRSIR